MEYLAQRITPNKSNVKYTLGKQLTIVKKNKEALSYINSILPMTNLFTRKAITNLLHLNKQKTDIKMCTY